MPEPKLLDHVRTIVRLRHLSPRTEEAYLYWIKKFIFFHHKRHPLEMGEMEIRSFLSYLAEEAHVAASTQNQALNALVFLYGSGLRLMECVRLRINNVDIDSLQITVRDGKGEKQRVTIVPQSLVPTLRKHLEKVKDCHLEDLKEGFGGVFSWNTVTGR